MSSPTWFVPVPVNPAVLIHSEWNFENRRAGGLNQGGAFKILDGVIYHVNTPSLSVGPPSTERADSTSASGATEKWRWARHSSSVRQANGEGHWNSWTACGSFR